MNKSESIAALAAALAKAQAEIENASKSSVNPHFKSKYADLAEVLNTVRPVFAKHGIAVIQAPSFDAGVAHVETMLTHSSGEWLSNTCSAPVSKQDAQGVGSAITYPRRYSLKRTMTATAHRAAMSRKSIMFPKQYLPSNQLLTNVLLPLLTPFVRVNLLLQFCAAALHLPIRKTTHCTHLIRSCRHD
jgi:hypothetical protein